MLEQPKKDILVVGGGIIGLCCALRLQQAGWQTTIVDPGDFSRAAASGNAGHIAIEQAEPLASRAALRTTLGQFVQGRGPLGLPLRDIGTWAPFAGKLYRFSAPARHEAGKVVLGALLADAMPAWRRLADDIGASDL
ncbi:MAG TPA: FAD-dependent oxidoreductase, partial [Acidiphilium sp.]